MCAAALSATFSIMSNAGWYDDGAGRQRWWDGAQWTEHYAPQQQTQAVAQVAPQYAAIQSTSMAQTVASYVHAGWRVESQGAGYAVVVWGNRPNHILHLILTLVTFGFWAIVWLIIGISSRETRKTIQVDGYGNVVTT